MKRLSNAEIEQIANPVVVGQVWSDNDPRVRRSGGRTLTVQRIRDGKAECTIGATGRWTKIKLSRFKPTSTGYRLIIDENGKRLPEGE